ncbi:MAG: sodium-dependent transporter [Eubacterium sp.]|nr:sodium-dependent transporter [Eubacterium sp.]MBP3806952.1 sodium-dependent transporter [Eubacterium sp.]
MAKEKREGFRSRLGFILVSAGCAIGIGNVWKFPYIVGQNGGAIFVLYYILFIIIMGIPILTIELSIGRASKKTIVEGYKRLEPPGSKWHIHGWFCLAGNYLIMMYYTTVAGWMLAYSWKFLVGDFSDMKEDKVSGVFDSMLNSPLEMGIFMAIIVLAGFFVLSFGVQSGLERVTKLMMIGLLGLILVLVINSFTLKNAGEGISFYLLPNLDNVEKVGLIKVITAAMNQAFFTLSIGIATMEVLGSYMSDENAILGEAVKICSLDTFVAIASGFIIFPACFSYGMEPTEGPALIFVTLPRVFNNMTGGRIWGILFFLFMTFAAFSTVTAIFENLISSSMDNFKWGRIKSVIINCVFMLIASIPCVLGYNILKNVHPIGGRNILDSEDFLVSNIILPIGALIFLIFCITKYGWGADKFLEEANKGKGMKISPKLIGYFKYVLPVLIIVILISGLMG